MPNPYLRHEARPYETRGLKKNPSPTLCSSTSQRPVCSRTHPSAAIRCRASAVSAAQSASRNSCRPSLSTSQRSSPRCESPEGGRRRGHRWISPPARSQTQNKTIERFPPHLLNPSVPSTCLARVWVPTPRVPTDPDWTNTYKPLAPWVHHLMIC